jgi:hypothetical protein
LTPEELIERMSELELTVPDVAILAKTTRRAVEKWRAGLHPVPQTLVLLLDALKDGKIDMEWLAERIAAR